MRRIATTRSAMLAALLLLVALGAIAVSEQGAPLVAAALAGGSVAVLAAYLALPARARGDALNPGLVVAAFTAIVVWGRAAYVAVHDRFGLAIDAPHDLGANEEAYATAVATHLGAAALVCAGVALALRRARGDGEPAADRPAADAPVHAGWLRVALLATFGAGLWAWTVLIAESEGVEEFFRTTFATRQIFFDERGPLYVLLAVPAGGFLAWFALRCRGLRTGNQRMAAALLFLVAAGVGLSGGARSSLVFLLVLPALVVYHYRARRVPVGVLVATVLVLFVASAVIREQTRDGHGAAAELYADGLRGLATNTFASVDARLADAVAELRLARPSLRYGETLAAAVAAPVPRAVWGGKPESANAQFTRIVDEDRLEVSKAELALTFAGEALWNFSWAGLALFLAIGYALGHAYALVRRRATAAASVAYGASLALALMLVRSDAFNVLLAAGKTFVPALLVVWIAQRAAAGRGVTEATSPRTG